MLDIRRDANPSVHARFVDRAKGRRKVRVGESAYRNTNDIGMAFQHVMNGCAADGAEMKRCLAAGIADSNKGC